MENLKAEYNYTSNATAIKSLKRIAAKQDSVFFHGHPLETCRAKPPPATLLTIGDESARVADFVDYLNIVKIRNAEAGANTVIDEQLTLWSDKLLLDYEDAPRG